MRPGGGAEGGAKVNVCESKLRARNPKIAALFCLPATSQNGYNCRNRHVVPVLHIRVGRPGSSPVSTFWYRAFTSSWAVEVGPQLPKRDDLSGKGNKVRAFWSRPSHGFRHGRVCLLGNICTAPAENKEDDGSHVG